MKLGSANPNQTNNKRTRSAPRLYLPAAVVVATLLQAAAYAEQPPAPCHPNKSANSDVATVKNRGDIKDLPAPLKPVNQTHTPWRWRGGYVSARISAVSGRVNHSGNACPRFK